MKEIEKLNIDLFPKEQVNERIYNEERLKYIADYQVYDRGGFLSTGYYKNDAAQGEANWNKLYPNGYNDWANSKLTLTTRGLQNIVDKINEIIDTLQASDNKK